MEKHNIYTELKKKSSLVREILYKDYLGNKRTIGGSIEGPNFLLNYDGQKHFDLQILNPPKFTTDLKIGSNGTLLSAIIKADERVIPGMNASFSFLRNKKKMSAEVQYVQDYAAISSSIVWTTTRNNPVLRFSGVTKNKVLSVGADMSLDIMCLKLRRCNVIIGHSNNDHVAAFTFNPGKSMEGSYYHAFSSSLSIGTKIRHSFSRKKNLFTTGIRYEVSPSATIKARVNNLGHLGALIQKKMGTNSYVTVSGEFDTSGRKGPKVGLAVVLNLSTHMEPKIKAIKDATGVYKVGVGVGITEWKNAFVLK